MALFSSASSYLGVDFDSNSVKIVELKNERGRPKLVTYAYIDKIVNQNTSEKDKGSVVEIGKLIKQVCKKAKTTTTKAVTALPAFSVFSSILNLPAMNEKDLESAIKWEAKKVIPMPVEDMILDSKILEDFFPDPATKKGQKIDNNEDFSKKGFLKISRTKKKKNLKVLLTAAPKDLVKRYMAIFKSAGLSLLSLDTESFALIRSLVGNDRSPLMIVDIGSIVTNISVVANSVPILNRSIDIGGLTITKAIANSLNVNLERAEQFKYDIGMSPERKGQGSVPTTIENTLTPIVDELRYSLNLYRDRGQKDIEKIILTGGSSLLLNLPQYLSNLLNLRVFLGDPWSRVVYPEELKPVLDEIGPRYSVAVGLAMRDIE